MGGLIGAQIKNRRDNREWKLWSKVSIYRAWIWVVNSKY